MQVAPAAREESARRPPGKTVLVALTQDDPDKPPSAWSRARVSGTAHALACGHFHFLALAGDACFSWGRGSIGLLGHDSEEDESFPRRIDGLAKQKCVAIACGPYHSAAVTASGQLLSWGWTPFLAAGGGEVQQSFVKVPRPVPIGGGVKVAGIACGCFASAAWDAAGQLFTWGRPGSGQLGHGSAEAEAEPRLVEALAGVRVAQAAFGGKQSATEHTGFLLVRSGSGMLFSCGSTRDGRLGREWSDDEDGGEPSAVHHGLPGEVSLGEDGLLALTCVAAADNHAAAVGEGGELYVWGLNTVGVLGDVEEVVPAPLRVTTVPPLRHVACAAYATAGLSTDGEVVLLGGDPAAPRQPRLAVLPGKATALFAGGFHVGVLLAQPPKPGRDTSPDFQREPSALSRAAYEGLPDELRGAVDPSIASLLLDDCAGASALQLRHELRLLRDLLAAERAKLDGGRGGSKTVVQLDRPSADTWTDTPGARQLEGGSFIPPVKQGLLQPAATNILLAAD